ncbi:MAG: hypothetical protein COX77_01740 [Candidatus Komeilibacteria bacterium CG_4_10_14_0_2_um_filter_37_10]|uniref:Uncharacterized protein n=1 Tax=Candidatus Komeilibacteria bacterium CG_4_10_14_0_2_um_filter_37_10 TaxID=1974470 RepID=A0A2M7VFI9_9BACT|nr:MAG: hypothetical protein COX77_01740 [Candidatus Komeilibacteria bacterium CG_4_10_14_0_2_um_filter_37_10]PJA92545.1 MAG: hypothetical protein CO133_02675 [Candidatus Komeilibacteria bacterium CG_4_9_14_3_um_filter_37_5]
MYSNELYIVIPDNQGVKAYENGVYVLEWSDFVQLPKNMIACSSVQPITDNPKVRTLKYEVGITVTDLNKLFYSPERLSHKTHYQAYEMVNGIVQYQLHEFNNINSKQLSLFYNPYEKEQLLALDSLIKNEINPLLAINGLSIHLKWFDVQ